MNSIKRLFDVLKPIKTVYSFGGKKNSYIEYVSKGDEHENLSPKEYLDTIRPYLRDLTNDHKTPMKTGEVIDNESQSGEWKIQLVMLNMCISSKDFEELHSVYSVSNNIEIFMSSDTNEIIDKLFDTMLQRFQEAKETFERGSKFIPEKVGLLYYYFHKIDMKRGE